MTKILLSTKGENEDEVPKELVDFLHYVVESNEQGLPKECDERLRRLHESVQEIKTSTSVEVEYMKMEERERLIKEEAMERGIQLGKEQGLQLGKEQGLQLGKERGLQEGKTLFAELTKKLLAEKRYEDLERAARNSQYCDKLCKELKIMK